MLPITQKEISEQRKIPVHSPILCGDLNHLKIDSQLFLNHFTAAFKKMGWDYYDVKRKQYELLKDNSIEIPFDQFRDYYINTEVDQRQFLSSFVSDSSLLEKCLAIEPWRRRSVCSFELDWANGRQLKRFYPKAFAQAVGGEDLRSLPRVFQQTEEGLVDNSLFHSFVTKIGEYAQEVTPHIDIEKMRLTAHFMSVKARQLVPGNNSPEGAHEDGADFIVSALVINRDNITGAKSQVLEKLEDGSMVTLFERELQPGEFLFQADTGEEKHYGNDLWHNGLDVEIVLPKES